MYHMSTGFIGFAYLLRSICSVFTSFLVPCSINKCGRPITVLVSLVIHFIAILLLGPSKMFGFPESVNLVMTAIVLKGIADPFMFVPLFP